MPITDLTLDLFTGFLENKTQRDYSARPKRTQPQQSLKDKIANLSGKDQKDLPPQITPHHTVSLPGVCALWPVASLPSTTSTTPYTSPYTTPYTTPHTTHPTTQLPRREPMLRGQWLLRL